MARFSEITDIASNLSQLNPQLRTFKVTANTYNALESISEHLQMIENLNIKTWPLETLDHSIYLQNVRKFKIEYRIKDYNLEVPKIPLQFCQLKEFEINGRDIEYSDHFLEFLHEKLVKFLPTNGECIDRKLQNVCLLLI